MRASQAIAKDKPEVRVRPADYQLVRSIKKDKRHEETQDC